MIMRKRVAGGGGFGVSSLVVGLAFLLVGPALARAGFCVFCGGNAATVGDGIVFDELTLDGPGKPAGPFVTGLRSVRPDGSAIPVTLQVDGDELLAFTKDGTHRSVPLPGIVISLAMKDGRAYDVRLDSLYDQIAFWVKPQVPVPAYIFTVTKTSCRTTKCPEAPKNPPPGYVDDDRSTDSPPQDLCKAQLPEPVINPSTGNPSTGKDQLRAAFVFTGDHYTDHHQVTTQKKGTFNLACFGTASAKMHLLRHTTASTSPKGKATTLEQRTAMLRAITADYCSDGHSWTGDGTPLWWTDREQAFPLDIQPDYLKSGASFSRDIEAVWGTNGKLLCLNEPRRTPGPGVDEKTCEAPAVSRKMVTKGGVACSGARTLPRCSDFPWTNEGRSPWSEPPLRSKGAAGGKTLPEAYVVTVNRRKEANYCNGKPGRPISWR